MYCRNSTGRRVSILNDDAPAPTATRKPTSPSKSPRGLPYRLPSRPSYVHSRASSCASTPCWSPQTPPLIRSASLESSDMDEPSPITPDYHGDSLSLDGGPGIAGHPAYPMMHSSYYMQQPKESVSNYPPVPTQATALPYPHQVHQPSPDPSLSHSPNLQLNPLWTSQIVPVAPKPQLVISAPQLQQQPQLQQAASETSVRPGPHANRTKKGQHPCPLAKQFGCSDTFTTSGHASRHAKKHTGEKSAVCPDCGKDFTRKDNMEQHRKTHLNGRNANKGRANEPKSATSSSSRSIPPTKRPKASPLQSSSRAASQQRDSFSSTAPMAMQQQLPEFVAPSQEAVPTTAYPDPSSRGVQQLYPTFPADDALHTLARAASGQRRRFIS